MTIYVLMKHNNERDSTRLIYASTNEKDVIDRYRQLTALQQCFCQEVAIIKDSIEILDMNRFDDTFEEIFEYNNEEF